MNHSDETTRITMYETQGCLVVPIQEELTKEAAQRVQRSLLEQIHGRGVTGVVIDLSGVNIIDSILWDVFSKTCQMVNIIGFPSVITGLSPGAVASIIDLNLYTDDVTTALNLEEALEILTLPLKPDIDDIENVEIGGILGHQAVMDESDDGFNNIS